MNSDGKAYLSTIADPVKGTLVDVCMTTGRKKREISGQMVTELSSQLRQTRYSCSC